MGFFVNGQGPRVLYGNSGAQIASKTDKTVRVFAQDGDFGGAAADPDVQSAQALAFLREDLKSAIRSLEVSIGDTYVTRKFYDMTGGTKIEGVSYRIDGAGWYSRWDSSADRWVRVMGGEDPVIDDYYRSIWEQDAFCIRWDGNNPEGGITYGGRPDALNSFRRWVESSPEPCEFRLGTFGSAHPAKNYALTVASDFSDVPTAVMTDVRASSDTVIRMLIASTYFEDDDYVKIIWFNDKINGDGPGHKFSIEAKIDFSASRLDFIYEFGDDDEDHTLTFNLAPSGEVWPRLEFGNMYVKNLDTGVIIAQKNPVDRWISDSCYSILCPVMGDMKVLMGLRLPIIFIENGRLTGEICKGQINSSHILVNRVTGYTMYLRTANGSNTGGGSEWMVDTSVFLSYHTLSKADLTKIEYESYKDVDSSVWYLVTDASCLPGNSAQTGFSMPDSSIAKRETAPLLFTDGTPLDASLPMNYALANPSVSTWGSNCTVSIDKDGLYGVWAVCTTAGRIVMRINNIGFSAHANPTGPWIVWAQIRTTKTVSGVELELTDYDCQVKACQANVWTDFVKYSISSNSTYSTGSSGNNNGFIDVEVPGCAVGDIIQMRNVMLLNLNDLTASMRTAIQSYISAKGKLPFFWDSRGWTAESMFNAITGQLHSTHQRGAGLAVWGEHRPYLWTVSRVRSKHHGSNAYRNKNLWVGNKGAGFWDNTSSSYYDVNFTVVRDMTGPAGSDVAGDVIRVNFPNAYTESNLFATIEKGFTGLRCGKPYIFSAYVRADIDDFPFYMSFYTKFNNIPARLVKWESVGRKWKRVQFRVMMPQADEQDTSVSATFRFTKPREQYYNDSIDYDLEFGFYNLKVSATNTADSPRLVAGCDYSEDMSSKTVPPCNLYICGLLFEECVGGMPSEYNHSDFYSSSADTPDMTVVGPTVAAEFGVDQVRFIDRSIPSRFSWCNNPRSAKACPEYAGRGRTFVYDPSWTAVEYIETDGWSNCLTGIQCEEGDRVEIDVMQTNMGAINHPNLLKYSNLSSGWANGWYQASDTTAGRTIVPIKYGESPELYLTNCVRFDYHGDLLNTSMSGSYTKSTTSNVNNITMSNLSAVANTLFSIGDIAVIEFDWELTNWSDSSDSNQQVMMGWENDYHPVGHPCCPETPLLLIDRNSRKKGTYRAEMKVVQHIFEKMGSSVFHMSIYSNATGTFSWSNLRIWKAGSSNTFSNSDKEVGYSPAALTIGSEYVWSVWARADADPGETMALTLMYGSANASADGANYIYRTFPATSEWKRYWIRFIARTETTRLYFKCPKAGYYNANANVTATCMSPMMGPSGKGVMYFAGPKLELYNSSNHIKWGPDSFPGRWVPDASDPEYVNGAALASANVDWHYIIGECASEADRFGIYQFNTGWSAFDYMQGEGYPGRYLSKVYWPILMRGERCRLIGYKDPNDGRPKARLVKKDRKWETKPSDMRSWPENYVITKEKASMGDAVLPGFRSRYDYHIGDERNSKKGRHSYRFYGVRVYRNERLICDLLPVKDRLGTAFGFLDRARNKAVPFSGTTGVAAGPVVSIEYDPANGILPKIAGTTLTYNIGEGVDNEPDTAVWRRFGDAVQPVNERDWNMCHDMARVWAENSGDRRPRTDGYTKWIQGVRMSNLFFGWYPGKDGVHEIWISGGGSNPTRNSWLPGMMPWFATWNDDIGSYIPASDSMLLTRYSAPFHAERSSLDTVVLSGNDRLLADLRSGSGYQSLADMDKQWLCNDSSVWKDSNEPADASYTVPINQIFAPRLNNWEYTALGWIWTAYWGTPDISVGLCSDHSYEGMSSFRWTQGQTDGVAQSCIESKAPNVFWKNYTYNEKVGNDVWWSIGETEGHGMGTLGPNEWRRMRTEKYGYDPTGSRTDDGIPFVFMWLENPAGCTMKALHATASSSFTRLIDYFQTTARSEDYHEMTSTFIDVSVADGMRSTGLEHYMITDVDMFGNILGMRKGSGRSRFGHLTVFPDQFFSDGKQERSMWSGVYDSSRMTVLAGGYSGRYSTGQCSFFDRAFGVSESAASPNITYIGKATAVHSGRWGDIREL